MKKLLPATRYLIIIPVICMFIAATTLIAYGGIVTVQTVLDTIAAGKTSAKGAKELVLAFIQLADVFLLATVLYVISVGLYELFIDDLDLPAWLVIHDIDALKNKLIGVVIVVMGVVFLGHVITWHGDAELMYFGVPVALVIAALTYFISQGNKH